MVYTAINMNTVRKIWEKSNIVEQFPRLASSVRFNESMALHTTFRAGGPVDLFVEPQTRAELEFLISFFYAASVPIWITGGGSNLLVSDKGLRGVCISLAGFQSIGVNEERTLVTAGAGMPVEALVSWCADHGFSGLEQFAGLPGTVGGAVYMNARCYERSISDVFFAADVLYFRDGRGTVESLINDPDEWGYKKSPFQVASTANSGTLGIVETPALVPEHLAVILSVALSVVPGDRDAILSVMQSCKNDREAKGHFRFPSAGSMFKNNRTFGKPSGQIIDQAGLRGFAVGDAQVAPWHGNLVINTGKASSRDIRSLVEQVQKKVFDQTGFILEPEVIFAGEW